MTVPQTSIGPSGQALTEGPNAPFPYLAWQLTPTVQPPTHPLSSAVSDFGVWKAEGGFRSFLNPVLAQLEGTNRNQLPVLLLPCGQPSWVPHDPSPPQQDHMPCNHVRVAAATVGLSPCQPQIHGPPHPTR